MPSSLHAYRATIKDEETLLLQRLFAIRLLDLLYELNPPNFYDDQKDEILEPFRSIVDTYSHALDDAAFASSFADLMKARDKAKAKSFPKKRSKQKAKTK